jgi:membrane protease YdiL (CAAX protease family)
MPEVPGGINRRHGFQSEERRPLRKRRDMSPPPRDRILLVAVLFEGGAVVLWLALGRLLDMPPGEQGEASLLALVQGVAATAPLFPVLFWISRSRFGPVRRMMKEVNEVLVPLLAGLTAADYALIALLAGIGEEGVFRGIIQGGLSGVMPEPAALLLAAALFGVLHFITPAYAVLAGLLGLYMGVLYLVTGNLLVPIVVHSLYDFVALLYLVRWRK